ncbi:MAG: hypothetical protein SGILL_005793 [Bacillariaceae sp.]
MRFSLFSSALLVLTMASPAIGIENDEHPRVGRLRNSQEVGATAKWWKSFQVGSLFKQRNEVLAFEEQADGVDGFFQVMAVDMSMPTASPTVSAMPSVSPTVSAMPSSAPSVSAMPSNTPSVSAEPSTAPTVSAMPSHSPTVEGVGPTPNPSDFPTFEPSGGPTFFPTLESTGAPSASPSDLPSTERSRFPTFFPTTGASLEGSASPSISSAPSEAPSLFVCRITPEQRIVGILGVLDQVANSDDIRNINTPQGQATNWILNLDEEQICPDDPKIIQRWALAVMYFSTEGDNWTQCSAGAPFCGVIPPFVGRSAFLSEVNECDWAGIRCNIEGCVTAIEFEDNQLGGTIPTELALLTDLEFLGMEEGTTSGTIPTELGSLSNMFFIDLDFNQLSGTIPPELFGLSLLRTLDLNDNEFVGILDPGLGNLVSMEFFQVHNNNLFGPIPSELGNMFALDVFTLYGNDITGAMPNEVCELRTDFELRFLVADCRGPDADVQCSSDCCTGCRRN